VVARRPAPEREAMGSTSRNPRSGPVFDRLASRPEVPSPSSASVSSGPTTTRSGEDTPTPPEATLTVEILRRPLLLVRLRPMRAGPAPAPAPVAVAVAVAVTVDGAGVDSLLAGSVVIAGGNALSFSSTGSSSLTGLTQRVSASAPPSLLPPRVLTPRFRFAAIAALAAAADSFFARTFSSSSLCARRISRGDGTVDLSLP
jgi:hypothetical protein